MYPCANSPSSACTRAHTHLCTLTHPCACAPVCPCAHADPAAENFNYPVSFDVRELITLEDVMEEMQLGPNGWVAGFLGT